MIPGRPPLVEGDSELEALQTDVMRFVAILGLCLAALFSLVRQADLEAPHTVVGGSSGQPAAVIEEAALAQLDSKPAPVPVPAPEHKAAPGHTLEFASEQDLLSLLDSGSVRLFARVEDDHWLYRKQGYFQVAEAPTRFHEMAANTVPAALVARLRVATSHPVEAWAVVLSPDQEQAISEAMQATEGGRLLLLADGSVLPDQATSIR